MLERVPAPTIKNNLSGANPFFAAADKTVPEQETETIVQRDKTHEAAQPSVPPPPANPPSLPDPPSNTENSGTSLPPPSLPLPNVPGDISIDYFAMSQPYFNRGVSGLRMDANSGIEQQWMIGYNFGKSLGLSDVRSAWVSNKLTPAAIDFTLSHDNPTRWERMSNEMGVSPLMFPIPGINFKLEVNQPHDAAEQEADSVAEKIVDNVPVNQNAFFKPAAKPVQRSDTGVAITSQVGSKVNEVLQQPGEHLPEQSRQFFESRFGQDFSDVRIHTDQQASETSEALQAKAFTSGKNIVFREGQFQPGTIAGNKLIAHELTHILQQNGTDSSPLQRAIQQGEPHDDGFIPIYSNATTIGGLYQDLRGNLQAQRRTGDTHALVFSQYGLAVYNIQSNTIVRRYSPRITEGMMTTGVYFFDTRGGFEMIGIRDNHLTHSPRSITGGFSPERLEIIRQRENHVLLQDYIEADISDLARNNYLPAFAISGRVSETAGTNTSATEPWAEGQVAAVQSQLRLSTSSSDTPNASMPERLVTWARQDGRQFVNVWNSGAVQSLELHPGESPEILQSRIEDASTELHDSRDATQSTEVANGAEETGFTETNPAGVPSPRQLEGSGAVVDPDPERIRIANADHIANLPPYRARINNYGTDVSVSGGNNRMSMEIDYSIAGSDTLSQVTARMQYIRYFWEIFDVTNVTDEELRRHAAEQNSEASNAVVSGEGNQLRRDFSNIGEDQMADLSEIADAGIANLNPAVWQVRSAQLALMGISTVVRSIGSFISSFISIVTTPLNEKNIGWDREGDFLVRCTATPDHNEDSRYIRASSVAVQPIRVMNVNTRAAAELNRPEAELQQLRDQLRDAPPGPLRDDLLEQIASRERNNGLTTMSSVNEQVQNVRQRVGYADEIIAMHRAGSAPTSMSVGARLLRVQLEINGATAEEFKEHEQQQLEGLESMQRYGNTQLAAMKPPTYRPRVVLASEENGQVFQMVMVLGELINSTEAHRRYRLVDMSSPSTQDYYDGESRTSGQGGHQQAINNAFIRFRENNGYGRGTIAIHLPPGLPDGVHDPATMRSAPGSRARWMQRLSDLATAAEVAGLVVTGPLGTVVGLAGGVAGAAVAVDSLLRRSHAGRFRWNFETVMEITSVVGGIVPFAGLSRRYARGVYYFGIAQLGQSALVIPYQLYEQINSIEGDPSLTPGEKSARRAEAFLQAVRSGVVTIVSARQMQQHGAPEAYVEPPTPNPAEPQQGQRHADQPEPVVIEGEPTRPQAIGETEGNSTREPSRPVQEHVIPVEDAPPHAQVREEHAQPHADEEGPDRQQDEDPARVHTPRGAPRPTPLRAIEILKNRIFEILNSARGGDPANASSPVNIDALITENPDLAMHAQNAILQEGSFRLLRQLIDGSFFGSTLEHNQVAREVLQAERLRLANEVMNEVQLYISDRNPNLTMERIDLGSPGFASDRDITLRFTDGASSSHQIIDASLQAVERCYEMLRRRGIEPDLVLDTNFYTELHESSIRPGNPREAAQILLDQSVVSLAEMRMGMNEAQWQAYREAQTRSLTGTDDASSTQGTMEAEARIRMEAEFAAAEEMAQRLRPQGQTTGDRAVLLSQRRQALSEALRRNASPRELRQIMAEIKLLEPEAYGTRAAVESVVDRQQRWRRGTSRDYMRSSALPEGRVERLAFLAQDASAQAGLLYGHSLGIGNQPSHAQAAAKYFARILHAFVVDGRLPAGAAEAFGQNLSSIIETKNMSPVETANATLLTEMRLALVRDGVSGTQVETMSTEQVTDAWVQRARQRGMELVAGLRTAEQMAHVQEGGPNPFAPATGGDIPPSAPGSDRVTIPAPGERAIATPQTGETASATPTADSLPTVDAAHIPLAWRATLLPPSGGADVILYRGFARNAGTHISTVVRDADANAGGILSRMIDTAQDAIFNQVGREPVLTGDNRGGVVQIRIPAPIWDALVRTGSISERGNYPGFSRRINSTEIRVNSVEAARLITSLEKSLLPPDLSFDFR